MKLGQLLGGQRSEAEPAQPVELTPEHRRIDVQPFLPRNPIAREPVIREHDVRASRKARPFLSRRSRARAAPERRVSGERERQAPGDPGRDR